MHLELQAFCGIATLVKASRRGGTTDNHGRLTLWSGQLMSAERLVFGVSISAGTQEGLLGLIQNAGLRVNGNAALC